MEAGCSKHLAQDPPSHSLPSLTASFPPTSLHDGGTWIVTVGHPALERRKERSHFSSRFVRYDFLPWWQAKPIASAFILSVGNCILPLFLEMKECLPHEDPGSWERDGNLSFKKKKKARVEQILFQWMQFYSGVPKLNMFRSCENWQQRMPDIRGGWTWTLRRLPWSQTVLKWELVKWRHFTLWLRRSHQDVAWGRRGEWSQAHCDSHLWIQNKPLGSNTGLSS